MTDVSVLVPAKDEGRTIAPLYAEITAALAHRPDLSFEVIFVDDGSTDDTWAQIRALSERDRDRVRAIRFRRTFGKAAALSAALDSATGSIVVTIDADMQDNPHELPRLLAELESGRDLISGYKRNRQDPLGKRLPSRVFNAATGWVTGLKLHDHNSGLRVARREVYEAIPLYGELHRYVPALAHAQGFLVTELPVHHRPRRYGRSKYGLERYPRGALDLLTVVAISRFGRRPAHLIGGVGLLFGLIGTTILTYLTGIWIFTDHAIGMRPLLQLGILLDVLAVQLVGMGLLAELVIHRTRDAGNGTLIAARLGSEVADPGAEPAASAPPPAPAPEPGLPAPAAPAALAADPAAAPAPAPTPTASTPAGPTAAASPTAAVPQLQVPA
jgi:dolichol-phosphate mannosyltransferase